MNKLYSFLMFSSIALVGCEEELIERLPEIDNNHCVINYAKQFSSPSKTEIAFTWDSVSYQYYPAGETEGQHLIEAYSFKNDTSYHFVRVFIPEDLFSDGSIILGDDRSNEAWVHYSPRNFDQSAGSSSGTLFFNHITPIDDREDKGSIFIESSGADNLLVIIDNLYMYGLSGGIDSTYYPPELTIHTKFIVDQ